MYLSNIFDNLLQKNIMDYGKQNKTQKKMRYDRKQEVNGIIAF